MFQEGDVQHPVSRVLDPPVAAGGLGVAFDIDVAE